MKVVVLDSPVNEPVFLEENSIQGLYPVKDSCQSYWTLLSKIELADFRKKEAKI